MSNPDVNNSFLRSVALHLRSKLGNELNTRIFVFPNQRAGLFFLKHLAQTQHTTTIAPQVTTINRLFDQLSNLGLNTDRIDLVMTLYEVYCQVMKSETTLDDFLFWGQMMLSDFDEIDDHLLDYQRVYVETANVKELDATFIPNLSEQQKEAIHALFGDNELTQESDETVKSRFAHIWKHLATIRNLFEQQLIANGRGIYKGLQHKNVIMALNAELEETKTESALWAKTFGSKKLVFIGFNALTGSEERLMEIAKLFDADFYWDYQSPDLRDLVGSLHLHNEDKFPSRYPLTYDAEPRLADFNNESKTIQLLGVASNVVQTKVARQLLDDIAAAEPSLENTAVVLPDEQLLLPMLNSINPQIEHVNVTMGYPMVSTPVYAFLDYLCRLQLNKRTVGEQYVFYHKDVESILCHSYVKHWEQTLGVDSSSEQLLDDIFRHHRIYSSEDELQGNELLSNIFRVVDKDQFVAYLIGVLNLLLSAENERCADQDQLNDMQIFLAQYIDMLERLNIEFKGRSPLELQGLVRLIRQLSASETISFRGEPLQGLQVMGALEARALDFNNLIILSVNEGIFPKVASQNSFIPYRVRRAYGLPTHELNDSIESYNFYRMLMHAKNVYLIYDIRDDGERRGEVSRYVMQLRYKYGVKIEEKQVHAQAHILESKSKVLAAEKTQQIIDFLTNRLTVLNLESKYRKGLSASALKTYLKCSFKYYLNNVEHIREDDRLEDKIQTNEFGNIVHKALEMVYKDYVTQHPQKHNLIERDVLARWLGDDSEVLKRVSEAAFRSEYLKTDKPIRGQDSLILGIVERYVEQIIRYDLNYAPFVFVGAEHLFEDFFLTLSDGRQVILNGSIDRMDLKLTDDGRWVLRVVDYKTGSQNLNASSMENLFSREKSDDYNIMQACLYSMVVEQMLRRGFTTFNGLTIAQLGGETEKIETEKIEIEPHLFFVRNSSDVEEFKTNVSINRQNIVWSAELSAELNAYLGEVVSEMFNPDIPFRQTEYKKQCTYCPFGTTCQRETTPNY